MLIMPAIDKYLFINYNKIANYILIIYKLTNFDHMLGVVSSSCDCNFVLYWKLSYKKKVFLLFAKLLRGREKFSNL